MIQDPPITVAIHELGRGMRHALRDDVRRGLGRVPRWLPPKWFYDDRGCALFDDITRLPEYYQTRTEASILTAHAAGLVERVRPQRIVEIGSGTCDKTRILLDAAWRQGSLEVFVPFDVSHAVVHASSVDLVETFPGLRVEAVVGDFASHLGAIPTAERQLVVFLGSTIGNLDDTERARFLEQVRLLLGPDSAFLLGVDLVKPESDLVAAYDDSQGVTAAFNRNVLRVINRELDADFDEDAFDHVAVWNAPDHRIEMHLRARRDQQVVIPAAGMSVALRRDETIRTEISVKFTRDLVTTAVAAAGMRLEEWLTDPGDRFALALIRPVVRNTEVR
jgi:L-histidine Nalpha-methyltransferase